MVLIEKVSPDGPLGPSRVAPGDRLLAVNGRAMRDLLDVRFAAADEQVDLEFQRPDGSRYRIALSKDPDADLGLAFEPMPIRACNNKCDFCFVFQQPKKTMRRDLYIMDDDFRYSFLYGNFITLTNIGPEDIRRILDQRLSPLYISVHCTDDEVRRKFLRSPGAPPILPLLRRLVDGGIRLHTQVVLIPDFNDGAILERTIDELAGLYPGAESLAVVPVGLTRYRTDLPLVRSIDRTYARHTVRHLRDRGRSFRRQLGAEFLYVADEFFVLAGRPFPRATYYDDLGQVENGVGMSRLLLDHFRRHCGSLPRRLDAPLTLFWVTGTSAATFLKDRVLAPLAKIENLRIEPVVVTNRFFGDSVTVSGLLTGEDIRDALRECGARNGLVLLPPNCLNMDGLFLDDRSPDEVASELGLPLLRTDYDFMPLLRSILMSPARWAKRHAA